MADVAWHRTGQLVHRAFEILSPHENGLPAKAVLVSVEAAVQLRPFENSDLCESTRCLSIVVCR